MNNAGIYIGKPFTEHTAEDYAAVMNVNMAGFFYITQLAIAEMEKHSSGHVVSVTTSIDQVAINGIYSVLAAMTKGGLNAATKSLAIEYAKKGIRVNAVAPGNIKTPMHAPENHEALSAFQPIGRMGDKRYRQRHPVSRLCTVHHRRDSARRRWAKCRPLRCAIT